MSVTVQTPDVEQACAYCGSPTFFCNYACLSAYIEEEGLTAGDACEWSPE